MTQLLRRGSRGRNAASPTFWAAGLLIGALTVPALVQASDSNVHLILSMKPLQRNPTGKSARSDAWFLRPNVEQELLTYVRIDEPSKKPKIIVQLRAGGVEIASQKVETAEEKFIQVEWPRLLGGPNSTAKPIELMTPVELRLLVDGKLSGEAVKLDIYRPEEYLNLNPSDIPRPESENKNRLIAIIKPKAMDPTILSPEPPCRMDLILDPERYSGFLSSDKKRIWSGNVLLGKDKDPLYLVAEDVDLRPAKRRSLVMLSADRFDRAFLGEITSSGAASPPTIVTITDTNILRINAKRYADPREKVRVTLQADRVERPEDRRLALEVLTFEDAKGTKHFSRIAEFRGDRDIRWTYAGGGRHGGLQLKPDVKDWSPEVDLSGFHGSVTLRLRLLDEKNEPMRVHDLDEEKGGDETKEVTTTIVLDDTPPQAVRFEKAPRPAVRSKPFLVQARGIDDESGIRDVVFFIGKLPANAPVPPEAIARPGNPIRPGSSSWATELVAPSDARSPLDVSVRFTNNVGLSTTEVIALEVRDPPPPPPPSPLAAKKGSIAGVVMEGERAQKGLKVDLLDPAGKVLLSTTTASDGAFVFKDLLPGDYKLASVKTSSSTQGSTRDPIPLAAGEDKKGIVIKLWRQ